MVRTLIGVAVACLLGGLLSTPATPAHAAGKVVLHRPVATDGAAKLSGRAVGHDRVVLQKRRAGGWKDVRRLEVRHGRYRTAVLRTDAEQVFRTRAGSATSRTRKVLPKPTPAPSRDACGTKVAKAGGGYWTCTFADDFDGTRLDRTKWVPQTIFATGDALSGYACYDDDPSVVSVGGGTLNLSVRRDASASPCDYGLLPTPYRAGMVSTYHLFSQRYGRFEARFRS